MNVMSTASKIVGNEKKKSKLQTPGYTNSPTFPEMMRNTMEQLNDRCQMVEAKTKYEKKRINGKADEQQ